MFRLPDIRVSCTGCLKDKIIFLTVGFVVAFVWLLVFFSLTIVKNQFERDLAEQRFASTKYLAAELGNKLSERVEALGRAAADIPPSALDDPLALQSYLGHLRVTSAMFSGGVMVIGLDGKVVADYPVLDGRAGASFGDRDYFRQAVATQKPYIDKPIRGAMSRRPLLVISVPVFDAAGRLRAVMGGVIDLSAPNFLGLISDRSLTGYGELNVLSLRDNVVVAATDTARVLAPLPAGGMDQLYDRFSQGFEGSATAVGADGAARLISGARVPLAGWLVEASVPTAVAFRPLSVMRNYVVVIAVILTLVAIVAIDRMVRRSFAPLEEATGALLRMMDGRAPLATVPVARDDEVGRLIGSFNLLIEDRQRYEAALLESEQRFRMLVDGAPDAIFVQTDGCFAFVNAAALELFGGIPAEQLLGKPVSERLSGEHAPIDGEVTTARPRPRRHRPSVCYVPTAAFATWKSRQCRSASTEGTARWSSCATSPIAGRPRSNCISLPTTTR